MLNKSTGSFLSVVAGVIIHVTLGTFYTWGNLSNYAISAIRYYGEKSNPRLNDAAILVSALLSGQALAMPVGGYIGKTYSSRLAVALGGVVMCAGTYFTQHTLTNYLSFVLVYGLIYGLGIGLAYSSPINCAQIWFPGRRGMVTGIITAGFGSGAMIFNQVHRHFINPNNLSPTYAPYEENPNEKYFIDPTVIERIPQLFPYLTVIYFTLYVIGTTLLIPPPSASAAGSDDERHPLIRDADKRKSNAFTHYTVQQALGSPKLLTLMILFFLNGCAINFVASFWKIIGAEISLDHISISDKELSWIGSVGSMANAFGRIGWGTWSDAYSFTTSLRQLCILWAACIAILPHAARYGSFTYGAVVFLNFFCLGGNFSMFPAAVSRVFGSTNFGIIFGIFFLSQIGSSVFAGMLAKSFYSMFGPKLMCLVIAGFCLCCTVVLSASESLGYDLNEIDNPPDSP